METLILRAYLSGYVFWLGAALGCLAISMIHSLTGGQWAGPLQGALRAGRKTIPWLAPFFIPIVLGLGAIFPWVKEPAPYGPHERIYYSEAFFDRSRLRLLRDLGGFRDLV